MAKETNNKYEIMAESSANIQTDAQYLADAERVAGVVQGVARSILYNTAARQNSKIAVAVANFMARKNPLTDITSLLTTEQLDALLEDAIKDAAASGPGSQVITVTYVSAGRFVANITPYVFNDQNKLTLRFSGVIPDADLDLPVKVSVDNGTIDYLVKVKDAGNQFLVRNTITEIADVFRNGSEVIINRTEPAEASESKYDLPIQSQQTIVAVEGSPFGDNKIEGESDVQVFEDGDLNNITDWTGVSSTLALASNILTVTLNGTGSLGAYSKEVKIQPNSYSLIKTRVYNADGLVAILRIGANGTTTSIKDITIPAIVGWHDISYILTPTDTATIITGITLYYRFQATIAGQTFKIDGNGYGILVIPLLSVKQLAMTLTQLEAKYPVHFESLKSVKNPEIKVNNENIFNKNLFVADYQTAYKLNDNGNIEVIATDGRDPVTGTFTYDIKVKPNTEYTISNASESTGYRVYTESGIILLSSLTLSTQFITNDETIIHIKLVETVGLPVELADIIINEGSTASKFLENDNSSKKYPLQTLKSVTDGTEDVEDYIDTENNDLHELVGNDFNDIIKGETWSLEASGTNQRRFLATGVVFDPIIKEPASTSVIAKISLVINGKVYTPRDQNSISTDTTPFNIAYFGGNIRVTSDEADLTAWNTFIAANDVEFQYELETEIITEDIDVDGIAFAYKNMTIELIQDNGFGFSAIARHALNDPETIRSLGKALQTAEKQITKLEDDKVDKVSGKELSTNDYDNVDKAKIDNITISGPIDLDKVTQLTELLSTKVDVPSTDQGTTANITLSESMDTFDFLLIKLGGSALNLTPATILFPVTGGFSTAIEFVKSKLEWYSFNFHRVSSTTIVADEGEIYTMTTGSPANVVPAVETGIDIIKIYGIKI